MHHRVVHLDPVQWSFDVPEPTVTHTEGDDTDSLPPILRGLKAAAQIDWKGIILGWLIGKLLDALGGIAGLFRYKVDMRS